MSILDLAEPGVSGVRRHQPQHQPCVPQIRPAQLQLPSQAPWVSGGHPMACPFLPESQLVLPAEMELIPRGERLDWSYHQRRNVAFALSLPWGCKRLFC